MEKSTRMNDTQVFFWRENNGYSDRLFKKNKINDLLIRCRNKEF